MKHTRHPIRYKACPLFRFVGNFDRRNERVNRRRRKMLGRSIERKARKKRKKISILSNYGTMEKGRKKGRKVSLTFFTKVKGRISLSLDYFLPRFHTVGQKYTRWHSFQSRRFLNKRAPARGEVPSEEGGNARNESRSPATSVSERCYKYARYTCLQGNG